MIEQNANKSNKRQEDFVQRYKNDPSGLPGRWLSERQTGIVAHGNGIGGGHQHIEQLPV
jgi:hypothetical protein